MSTVSRPSPLFCAVVACVWLGACGHALEGALRFERVDLARRDPRVAPLAVLDLLPAAAGPVEVVFDPETLARCIYSRLPPAEIPALVAGLLESGFDAYRGEVAVPRAGCPFRARAIRRGRVFRNAEGDDEVPAIAVVDERGAFFFWWEAPG